MRLSLLLSLFILMIFGLVLVYQLADVPESFPLAHEIRSKLRGLFRSEPEEQEASSDFGLAAPGHVLPDANITNEGKDPCGPPPMSPWELDRPPLPADFERFVLASRIWDYCKQTAGKDTTNESVDSSGSQSRENADSSELEPLPR